MEANENYEITWLGYNEAPNYNQVWGYITMSDKRIFTFWGVKNGRMCFKRHHHKIRASAMSRQKEDKGFKKIYPVHYEQIAPGFLENLEIDLMVAILSD